MKIVLVSLLVLVFSEISFADDPRVTTLFKSENGKFLLKYSKKKWRLIDGSGKVRYHIKDRGYASMTIFVSNDGQSLVVIDDFMQGHKISDRPALIFYQNGKETANYKLVDILDDTCSVRKSIGHTTWSLEDYGLVNNDSVFSVATFEFNEFEFNAFNGELLKKAKPRPFDESTYIVYGKFHKGSNEQTTMSILKHIAGPKPLGDKITFKTGSYGNGTWTEALMIKDGVDVTPLRFKARPFGYSCLE